MGIPLFSTMAVAMLGGMAWMGAQLIEVGKHRDAEVTARVSARQVEERRAASAGRRDAFAPLDRAGERCRRDRERAIRRARRGGRWREPRSCERYRELAADWRERREPR